MRRLVDWASSPDSGAAGAYAFVLVVLATSWGIIAAGVAVFIILKGSCS